MSRIRGIFERVLTLLLPIIALRCRTCFARFWVINFSPLALVRSAMATAVAVAGALLVYR